MSKPIFDLANNYHDRTERFKFLKDALDARTPLLVTGLHANNDKSSVSFALEPAPMLKASGPPSLEASAAKVVEAVEKASTVVRERARIYGDEPGVTKVFASLRDLVRNFCWAAENAYVKRENSVFVNVETVAAAERLHSTLGLSEPQKIADVMRKACDALKGWSAQAERAKAALEAAAAANAEVERLSALVRLQTKGGPTIPVPEALVQQACDALSFYTSYDDKGQTARAARDALVKALPEPRKFSAATLPVSDNLWPLGDVTKAEPPAHFFSLNQRVRYQHAYANVDDKRNGTYARVVRLPQADHATFRIRFESDGFEGPVWREEITPASDEAPAPKFVRIVKPCESSYPFKVGEVYRVVRHCWPRHKWLDLGRPGSKSDMAVGSVIPGEYEALPDVPPDATTPGAVVKFGEGDAYRLVLRTNSKVDDYLRLVNMHDATSVQRPIQLNGGLAKWYTVVGWYTGGDFQQTLAEATPLRGCD